LQGGHAYNAFGATSAAAPAVAGAIAMFKHWYLDNHGGGVANQPGRLMSNILNFATGKVYRGRGPSSGLVEPPADGWGLGVLRMRLFEDGYMGSPWRRGTVSATLGSADSMVVAIGEGDESRVPRDLSRLRITAWWLEVNTGQSEAKASFRFYLMRRGVFGDWRMVGHVFPAEDGVARIQYECFGYGDSPPPAGSVFLIVYASSVPTEVRNAKRSTRSVYVSWFYERGEDPSIIRCGNTGTDNCHDGTAHGEPELDSTYEWPENEARSVNESLRAIQEGFAHVKKELPPPVDPFPW
jgi:hypothetical protein